MPSVLSFRKTWVSVPADFLRASLPALKSLVRGNPTLPILGHVLAEYHNGRTSLTTTDLDQSLTVYHDDPKPVGLDGARAAAHQWLARNGRATIHVGKLAEIAKLADKGTPVRIDWPDGYTGEAMFVCKGKSMKLGFESIPPEEFPVPPPVPIAGDPEAGDIYQFDWPPAEWDQLKKLVPAISDDETRYVLNGAFREGTTWVATDGRTLRVVPAAGSEPSPTFILPNKAIFGASMRKLVGNLPAHATIGGSNQFWLEWEGGVFVSKTIEGNYPNYRHVIPSGSGYTVTAAFAGESIEATIAAFRASCPNDKHKGCRLTIDAASGLTLEGPNIKPMPIAASLEWHTQPGEPFTVAFNPHWFAKFLEDGYIRWTLKDEESALYSSMPNGMIGVVMPMRLS